MVAAASLGDVVEESRDIQQLGSGEVGYQARAQRILVCMLRLGKAAQIADDHQDVLVDRVDVVEIVLHLTDDAAEHGQVPAEDAVLVHAPELVRDTPRLAQYVEEAGAIARVALGRLAKSSSSLTSSSSSTAWKSPSIGCTFTSAGKRRACRFWSTMTLSWRIDLAAR